MTIWSRLQALRSSLPGWTARKRAFVFDGGLAWDDWRETKITSGGQAVLISGETEACYRYLSSVEQEFPGFIAACYKLQTIGCDRYMTTSVLKHLIAHKSRHRLDQRMEILAIDQKVSTALALDISGDSLAAYLENGTKPKSTAAVLPGNMFEL